MDNSNKGFQTLSAISYVVLDSRMNVEWRYGRALVQIVEPYVFTDIYFTPGTGSWSETSQRERSGVIWNQKMEVICPPELITDFTEQETLSSNALMLVLTFPEGRKLLGRPGRGARMQIEYNDSKGLQVNLKIDHQDNRKAPWVYDIVYV